MKEWYFKQEFSENAQKLYDLLYTKNFDKDELIAQLASGVFSADDIDMAAYSYVDNCGEAEFEARVNNLFDGIAFGELVPGIESSHLVEAVKILLDYGMDPNRLFEYDDDSGHANIMLALAFVFNGYQAADAAAEILSRGGNPSLIVDDASLIRELNFELLYCIRGDEEFRYYSDSVAHYWMVFIGYGAKLENGGESVEPYKDFNISLLRNHRQYYYGMVRSERYKGDMDICFFDKDTNREVVRYYL